MATFPDEFIGHDQHKIVCRRWIETKEPPKAAVILQHGLAEHSGRYEALGRYLNENNVWLFSHDHRGHGQSDGTRVHVESKDHLVNDALQHIGLVRAALDSSLPLFLMGHSMGGQLVMLTAMELGEEAGIAGVIISSPAIKVGAGVSSLLIAVGKVVAFLAPQTRVSKLDPTGISSIPEEQQAYLDDPLNDVEGMRAGLAAELIKGMDELQTRVPSEWVFPFLVIHGDDDPITNIEGSNWLYEVAPSTDKTKFIVEGSRHETLRDTKSQEVKERILSWVLKRA